MNFTTLLGISFALGADSFTVSVSNGICYGKKYMHKLMAGILIFAITQGAMPLMGYAVGELVSVYMESFDRWVALILLVIVGGKMVFEAFTTQNDDDYCPTPDYKLLFMQAVATSIDAFTVGMSFAVMKVNMFVAIPVIVAVTAVCCAAGIAVGMKFGSILGNKATLTGGFLLIAMGINIFFS